MADKYAKLEQYVRAPQPSLPESQIKYLQEELRKLEVSLQGAYGALTSTGPYIKAPHALLMSDQDQLSAGTTSENLVSFNVPVVGTGVTVEDNTKLKFDEPGFYLITMRLQFANRGNSTQEIEVWAKNSGTNYALSGSRFDIAARKSTDVWAHTTATISGVFDVQDVGTDYLEMAWWSDGANVVLETYPVGSSPARPAVPSVILTATFVSGL
jgi:hypothetical protein